CASAGDYAWFAYW
nr:immunoglobulin heavy chain junction region [Mus musculus]